MIYNMKKTLFITLFILAIAIPFSTATAPTFASIKGEIISDINVNDFYFDINFEDGTISTSNKIMIQKNYFVDSITFPDNINKAIITPVINNNKHNTTFQIKSGDDAILKIITPSTTNSNNKELRNSITNTEISDAELTDTEITDANTQSTIIINSNTQLSSPKDEYERNEFLKGNFKNVNQSKIRKAPQRIINPTKESPSFIHNIKEKGIKRTFLRLINNPLFLLFAIISLLIGFAAHIRKDV